MMLSRISTAAMICGLALGICLSMQSPAVAGLHVCNSSTATLYAAVADQDRQDPAVATSQGWYKLAPGACKTPISLQLFPDDNYFVYAVTNSGKSFTRGAHIGPETHSFCMDPTNAFKLFNAGTRCSHTYRAFSLIHNEDPHCDLCPNLFDFTVKLK
jgi:uncharacterized membrane protein